MSIKEQEIHQQQLMKQDHVPNHAWYASEKPWHALDLEYPAEVTNIKRVVQ